MKLDDFLKCKKVKCVNYCRDLTMGKVYEVLAVEDDDTVKLIGDNEVDWYPMGCFEPVIDSAENPLQNMKLTPEFEALDKPKFKVGDKVYYGNENRILTIAEFDDDGWIRPDRWVGFINNKQCCHATPENHALLSKLYPHIEFEQPTKPLSGDDIVRAMLKKGIKNVLCLWGNGDKIIIDRLDYKGSLMSADCRVVGGLTPIDWYTGEPLTESVLDE